MNYLAKQAARARADAPVRPRLPALFEPAPIAPVADGAPPEVVVTRVEEPVTPAPRAIEVEQVLRRESEIVREVVERIIPERRLPAGRDEEGPAGRDAGETAGRMPALRETVREMQPAPPVPAAMERPRAESQEPPPPRTIVNERIVREIERIETREPAPREATPPRVAPIEPPPARPHAPVPVATRPAERAPIVPQPVESEPAVRITIGRVDVRAIVTPEAPQRPAPPAQPRTTSISLEDYLKQREGRPR